jgi:hypothetical protein
MPEHKRVHVLEKEKMLLLLLHLGMKEKDVVSILSSILLMIMYCMMFNIDFVSFFRSTMLK